MGGRNSENNAEWAANGPTLSTLDPVARLERLGILTDSCTGLRSARKKACSRL
jgi:hypothetical protein